MSERLFIFLFFSIFIYGERTFCVNENGKRKITRVTRRAEHGMNKIFFSIDFLFI